MILEINLVKTPSIDSTYGQLILRRRTPVKTDEDVMKSILSTIQDNIEFIEGAIADNALANKISNLSDLTINELYELKYYLNYFSGLDLWTWYVNDLEIGKDGVDAGMFEYTIVDKTAVQSLFVPIAQRFNVPTDEIKLSKIYTQISEMTGLFDSQLSDGIVNPIKNQIEVLIPSENANGTVSTAITQNINNIFNYMGKRIITLSE